MKIIDIPHEVLPDQLSIELLLMEQQCVKCVEMLELAKTYVKDQNALELIDQVIEML